MSSGQTEDTADARFRALSSDDEAGGPGGSYSDPRSDPRAADPRAADPRAADPRAADPRHDQSHAAPAAAPGPQEPRDPRDDPHGAPQAQSESQQGGAAPADAEHSATTGGAAPATGGHGSAGYSHAEGAPSHPPHAESTQGGGHMGGGGGGGHMGGGGGGGGSGGGANRLFVGGLEWGVTSLDVRRYFSTFGRVDDAEVLVDRNTGRSRGFGFVSFETEDGACVLGVVTVNAAVSGRAPLMRVCGLPQGHGIV